jgi:hypothetical protein
MNITVLTPSIGTPQLERAILSVSRQSIPVRHLIVTDGEKYKEDVVRHATNDALGSAPKPVITTLPDNTGQYRGEKWYGHRIYAFFTQLIDANFVAFLDEDNEYETNHIETLLERASRFGFSWSYRTIWHDGHLIGKDVQESIGVQNKFGYCLTDTSCWMFRQDHLPHTIAIAGGWGADRNLSKRMLGISGDTNFLAAGTGQHTMRYHAPDHLLDFFKGIVE